VIRIVRYEEEPKARLIETFALTEIQAEYILNTRLRQLARLEEMEISREHAELIEERDGIVALLGSEKAQWKLIGEGVRDVRKTLAKDPATAPRRSTLAEAPAALLAPPVDAFVTREAITVVLSERGWIRSVKGAVADPSELKFKDDDRVGFLVPAWTTDKLMLFASDGRVFTLACDKLPSGRSTGEPLRLMLDLDDRVKVLAAFAHKPGGRRLVASAGGYGFFAPEDEIVSLRRAGKQVLNLEEGAPAALCLPGDGDHIAVTGEGGRVLIFPAADLPEMGRGKGVRLQNYAGVGGLKDAVLFTKADGLGYIDKTGKRREWKDWAEWIGRRAGAGRTAPKVFARFDRPR
jgi:topoisomerase-4 subunit A